MERMKSACNPIFCDITWGAGGSTATLSMEMAIHMHQSLEFTTNLHMTCTNISKPDAENPANPKEEILKALQTAVENGIHNIVALRGDPPVGQTTWTAVDGGFTCALDLVKFMRQHAEFDAVGIAVAGYPEGHPNAITKLSDVNKTLADLSPTELMRYSTDPADESIVYCCLDEDYAKEMDYLKQKIDAGSGRCMMSL
jgi:methylenetetrahydrofolate reductase (NADPH)